MSDRFWGSWFVLTCTETFLSHWKSVISNGIGVKVLERIAFVSLFLRKGDDGMCLEKPQGLGP